MQQPQAENTTPLSKPCLFLPLEHSPLKKNTDYLLSPATGHLYCLTTGSIYQSPASNVPLSSNMQQLPGKMDIHLNFPPAPMPQVQIKPERVLSQSQKKKIERQNVHDHVRNSDKPPTFLHQAKNKQKLPKEACPSGKTKKKPTGKNMQSKPIKVNDPSINLKPQDKKPPDTESKPDLTTQNYPHAERKSAKRKHVRRQKKKKVKNTKPKEMAQQAIPAITSDPYKPNKRWRLRKQKRIYMWSFLKRFNRRPRKKTHRRHRAKESVWASKGKNCVLPSLVHDIVKSPYTKTSSKLMPESQLRAMLSSGGRKLIPHQAWMRSMEEEAIWKYKKMKSDCRHKVQVTDYEIAIHQQLPWLVGLCMWVTDRHTKEKWPLLVKCLYKYPDSTIRHASKHRSFCLKWNEVDYTLRNDHICYTQIQCLLAITDKIYAELLVHTHKETAIIPVYFDADFWEETEIRLETFYKNNIQPYLKVKGIEQDISWLDIVDSSEE